MKTVKLMSSSAAIGARLEVAKSDGKGNRLKHGSKVQREREIFCRRGELGCRRDHSGGCWKSIPFPKDLISG